MFKLTVYYEDTDAAGVVYYANYLRFAERARTHWLKDQGLSNTILREQHGLIFMVRTCEIAYHVPARLEDELTIHSHITEVKGATFRMHQEIFCGMVKLTDVHVTLVCVKADGRPGRLPEDVKKIILAGEGKKDA